MLSEIIAEKYKLRRYIQGKADGKLEGIAEGRSERIAEGSLKGSLKPTDSGLTGLNDRMRHCRRDWCSMNRRPVKQILRTDVQY